MALSRKAKEALVAEVNSVAASAHSVVAAEYRGLTVAEMTDLRSEARSSGVYVKIMKNTLAHRAVEGTDFQCLQKSLHGPLLLAFSQDDPGAAARVIKGFSKKHDKLVTASVAIGGELYAASDLNRLAALPTLDEARATLLRTLQAPLTQLVRTLVEPPAMLARALQARSDQAS
ncbi:MAG: 50S ribosomal protein L10 [Gammaproteobacteria bacterium]